MKIKATIGVIAAMTIGARLNGQTLEDAKRYLENEEFKKVIEVCNGLIAGNPKDAKPMFYRGMAYYKLATDDDTGKEEAEKFMASARENFSTGLSKDKKYAYNIVGMGLTDIAAGNIAEGKSNLARAKENVSNDVYLLIQMAEAYMEIYRRTQDKTEKTAAIDEATKLLTLAESKVDKTKPEMMADVETALGDVWLTQGVEEVAMTKYGHAVQIAPKSLKAHYALARLQAKQGKLNDAIATLKKITETIDPKFAPAYREMAEILFKAGQYDNSKYYAKKYVDILGNDVFGRVRYAQLLYLTKNYPEAVAELQSVMKDTTGFVLYRLLAYSLCEVGKYDEAETTLEKFYASVKPVNIIAKDYKYSALIYFNTGKIEKAEEQLAKYLKEDPKGVEIYKTFSDISKKNNDFERAAKYLDLYLKNVPNPSVNDEFTLGWLYYAKLKDNDKALPILESVAQKRPEVIEAHLYVARIKAKKDPDYKEKLAQPHYEKVIAEVDGQGKEEKYKKEVVEACSYLGYLYYDVEKNFNKSLDYYLRVEKLDPDNEIAKKTIPYLKSQGAKPTGGQ
jgi:tetratricopeptide (TPR) repeat protein